MPAITGPARYFFLSRDSGEDVPHWPPAVKASSDNLICSAARLTPEEAGWRVEQASADEANGHDAETLLFSRETTFGLAQGDRRMATIFALLGVRAIKADDTGVNYATHLVVRASEGRTRTPIVVPIETMAIAAYLEHKGTVEAALDLYLSPDALADAPAYLPDEAILANANRALNVAAPTPRARHDLLAEVEAGRVSLFGRAELLSTGEAARRELETTPGVVEVADYVLYDENLIHQVAEALAKKGLGDLNVLVEHNLVVLDGTVPDRKTFWTARDTALKVPGVRGVVTNQLQVTPAAEPTVAGAADLTSKSANTKKDLTPSRK